MCNNSRYEDLALRAEQAMRLADTALDHLAVANNNQGDADASSGDPVPDVEFDEEEVLRTCSDFIKVRQHVTDILNKYYNGFESDVKLVHSWVQSLLLNSVP